AAGGRPMRVVLDAGPRRRELETDVVVACAGGLSTPVLLARSVGFDEGCCHGYHDHPMAYVAKVRLRPDSVLKQVSCTTTASSEVRAGLVYEHDRMKTVLFLRPAIDLDLRSIRGPARFILSDLRNAPFSGRKILQLLANREAIREAVLFKTKSGFRGDCYSILLLGEQSPLATRGVRLRRNACPALDWGVSEGERHAYTEGLASFLQEFSGDIVDVRVLAADDWEFRTAAHHSGAATRFLGSSPGLGVDMFRVDVLPGVYVCDASMLRASGIANSGLTLV